jgi:aryl-alcohol dehydrogenase-like predicted oxidoreductase
MKTRTLPGTDLALSVVGFGCWAIGKTYWGNDVDDDVSREAVRTALDCGINWFDTAPLYGEGHADEVLVSALGPDKANVHIATKVGVRFGGDGEHANSDLNPDWIVSDTDASLARLGLERIDLLQIHWPCDKGTDLRASLDTLESLREAGKVRYYGLCNYSSEEIELASDYPGMVSLQTPYSLLRREFEGALRPACSAKPLGVLAYEPLCRGLLTGKFKTLPQFPETDLRGWDERFQGQRFVHARGLVADLERVAQKVGLPTAAVSIGWVLSQPGITAAIVGAKRPEQVRQNAQAAALADRPKVVRVIDQVAALHGGS